MLLKQVSKIVPWREVFALSALMSIQDPFVGSVCDRQYPQHSIWEHLITILLSH